MRDGAVTRRVPAGTEVQTDTWKQLLEEPAPRSLCKVVQTWEASLASERTTDRQADRKTGRQRHSGTSTEDSQGPGNFTPGLSPNNRNRKHNRKPRHSPAIC